MYEWMCEWTSRRMSKYMSGCTSGRVGVRVDDEWKRRYINGKKRMDEYEWMYIVDVRVGEGSLLV